MWLLHSMTTILALLVMVVRRSSRLSRWSKKATQSGGSPFAVKCSQLLKNFSFFPFTEGKPFVELKSWRFQLQPPTKDFSSSFCLEGEKNPLAGCRYRDEILKMKYRIQRWNSGLFLQPHKDFRPPSFFPLANFPAVFPTDFLGKPAEEIANGDHEIAGYLATSCKWKSVVNYLKYNHVTSGSGSQHNVLQCQEAPFPRPV